jgi:cation transport ATPase
MNAEDEIINKTLNAIFLIIGDENKRQKLDDEINYKEVLCELELPQSSIVRIRDIVHRLGLEKASILKDHEKESQKIEDKESQRIEDILLESFTHIRWSFWVSLVMSVILFIIGMFFLVTAVVKSFSEASVSTATLTIAGVGIADFILLFYTRPWQDISRNLSNSQQVKIIVTSYLSGVGLVSQNREENLKLLEGLTRNSIGLIQKYTEEKSEGDESRKGIKGKDLQQPQDK